MGSDQSKVMHWPVESVTKPLYAYGNIVAFRDKDNVRMPRGTCASVMIGKVSEPFEKLYSSGNVFMTEMGNCWKIYDLKNHSTQGHIEITSVSTVRDRYLAAYDLKNQPTPTEIAPVATIRDSYQAAVDVMDGYCAPGENWQNDVVTGRAIKFSRRLGTQMVLIRKDSIKFCEQSGPDKFTTLGAYHGAIDLHPSNKIEMNGDLLRVNGERFWFAWPPLPAVEDPYLPSVADIVNLDTRLPLELHSIVGEYVGNSHRMTIATITNPPAGVDADVRKFYVDSRVQIINFENRILVKFSDDRAPLNLETSVWDMFENHLVVRCGGLLHVIDINNAKNTFTSICSPFGRLVCGPSSFINHLAHLSYENARRVDDKWDVTYWDFPANIGHHHYVRNELARTVEVSYCARCAVGAPTTCIDVHGIHVNVPAFGRCDVSVYRTGSRVTISMTGKQGIHFQIHDTLSDDLTASTRIAYGTYNIYSFPDNAVPVFTGDGISVKDINGRWITISFSFFQSCLATLGSKEARQESWELRSQPNRLRPGSKSGFT